MDYTYVIGDGRTKPTLNYDLSSRVGRYTEDMQLYWNTTEVYSGMADNLQDRAREHTFAHPGTPGLALGRYPALAGYSWTFGFK